MACAITSCAVLNDTFFFFNDTATTEIYTLSLHDALPISRLWDMQRAVGGLPLTTVMNWKAPHCPLRSEEHTSELQSLRHLVCRLLLEKKKRGKALQLTWLYDFDGYEMKCRVLVPSLLRLA